MNESERLRSHTQISDTGCWIWQSSIVSGGYGAFMASYKKTVRAHRRAYELFVGPIGAGLIVCHACDNRLCVNPSHLFLGSKKDNTQDMLKKGRQHAKLSALQVEAIKKVYASGDFTQKEVGALYGVSQGTIHNVVSGKQWRHL